MPSPFRLIIAGELPARFVWQDDEVVAFLTIAPIRPGHALVVPRAEVDNWQNVDAHLFAQCAGVAQKIGQGQQRAFDAPRVGLIIAGLEVPHLHLHVIPMWQMADLDFARAGGWLPWIAASMCRICRVSATLWARNTWAPCHAQMAVVASVPSNRSPRGRASASPTKSLFDTETSTGQPVATSSPSRRVTASEW